MKLPSVTQVLRPFVDLSKIPPDVLAAAAERGTRVHGLCAAVAQRLWIPSVPDECRGYVDSFRSWFPVVVEVVAAEVELVDEVLGFKGHPDLIVRIEGDEGLTVVDLKTPVSTHTTWKAQLAAYHHLAEHNGHTLIIRNISLRLSWEGRPPQVDEYLHQERDFAAFLSALNAWRYFKGGRS